jgi:alkanesulfonate monooxygenase SsuD/methylene tetrahydromethanopterin reductase-like flavin-dependent oxidoreductase (luciferase family)
VSHHVWDERHVDVQDGLVAWGDVDTVAARIRQHHAAGADHVAIILLSATPDFPSQGWTSLAETLLS